MVSTSVFWLALVGVVWSQLDHMAGETISFDCSPVPKPLYFGTMREFTLTPLDDMEVIILSSDKQNCTLSQNLGKVCTFDGMTRQINVSCPKSTTDGKTINLKIERPSIIQNTQTINASLVLVTLAPGQEGVLSVLLSASFATEIMKLNLEQNPSRYFRHSDCLVSVAMFEDSIRLAVKKGSNPCTIGLINRTQQWRFDLMTTSIEKVDSSSIRGFIQANQSRTYELPDQTNLTVNFFFQTAYLSQMINLTILVTVEDSHKVSQNITIKNYHPGLLIFQAELFLNKSIQRITLVPTLDVFFSFTISQSRHDRLWINEDEYLYLHLSKDKQTQFILQLQSFELQQTQKRTIIIKEQNESPMAITYQECSVPDCNNVTGSNTTAESNQLTPDCNHLINDTCFIKVHLKSASSGYFGILPLAYNEHIELQPNKMHVGHLKREKVYHYVVAKRELVGSQSEIVKVHVSGAKAFLTYNKNCKRIACAQHWDTSGNIEIPNLKSDLFLFLVGTGHEHYTIQINTKQGIHIDLPQAMLVRGHLTKSQRFKYYTYRPADASKSFQINCNAIPGNVILLVNVRTNQFPQRETASYSSKDCYVYVSAKQYSKQDIIHISVERLNDESATHNFNIMALTEGNGILLGWTQPFYDFFQPNSTKMFKYLLGTPSNNLSIKVDIYQQTKMKPVFVQIGNIGVENETYTATIMDVRTFNVDKLAQDKICASQQKAMCYLNVWISNTGNFGLEISVTAWFAKDPIKLTMGQYSNFETGVLGEQINFYVLVEDHTKPINIYVYSTQVQIEVVSMLWNSAQITPVERWMFPSFKFMNQSDLDKISYSFSSSVHFSSQTLKGSSLGSIIMLTIRDKSASEQKLVQQLSVLGYIQIAVSNGYLKLREDDKFEYTIFERQLQYFEFPVGNLLLNDKQEIYFHNQILAGDSQIAHYFSTDKVDVNSLDFQATDFLAVSLDEYKAKQPKNIIGTQNSFVSIIFVIKTQTLGAKFIANIASSSTDFRQLTLGIPEQFYIPIHSLIVFEFSDYYNEDFKIKINREEGFPQYKVISCTPNQSKVDCIMPLLKKADKIKQISSQIVRGRSHELTMDSKGQHYCKGCTYYIAFYSHSEQVYGSLTITRPGQDVFLKEGQPLTTQVYSDQVDSYIVASLPTTARLISVIPHMGNISVEMSQGLYEGQEPSPNTVQNSTDGNSIELHIEETKVVMPFQIKVRSADKQNAMYSIVISSSANAKRLTNGLPLRATFKSQSVLILEYKPEGNNTILISSTELVTIDLTCKSNDSVLISRNKNVKHSQIFNSSLIHVSQHQCSLYEIQISNQKPLRLTVLANSEDIVLLPMGIVAPSVLRKNRNQVYQIPIQQRTHLKIVVKFCQSGDVVIGIATTKSRLQSKNYTSRFNIAGDRLMQVFNYTAKPGIVYLEMSTESDVLEYTIEIYPIQRDTVEQSVPKTTLKDSYIETTQISPGRFTIAFQPFKVVEDQVSYTVDYVLVESTQRAYLKKSVRCSGTFFDVRNPNTVFMETKLEPKVQVDGSLQAEYKTSQTRSYITLVPVVSPHLPAYTQRLAYDISELSAGKGPQFVQRMISKMLGAIEAITEIEDQNLLNFILILTIVLSNILLITFCCYLSARHCRKTIIIQRKRLATSEREGRRLGNENSLDMLDTAEEIKDIIVAT